MTVAKEMTLWELAGADEKCVFSPFVWRVRLVLYHKGLQYKSIPWRYTEKDLIKPSEKVLTLVMRGYMLLMMLIYIASSEVTHFKHISGFGVNTNTKQTRV